MAESDAAVAFLGDGRNDSARPAAHRAQQLHLPGQGGSLPRIDGQGLSNAEIADRLVVSVTVETHLYRAMQKLGVNDRRELRSEVT
jgi:DNA-binding NarL/FixJ family response regulator